MRNDTIFGGERSNNFIKLKIDTLQVIRVMQLNKVVQDEALLVNLGSFLRLVYVRAILNGIVGTQGAIDRLNTLVQSSELLHVRVVNVVVLGGKGGL